jgi:hypothetical protein
MRSYLGSEIVVNSQQSTVTWVTMSYEGALDRLGRFYLRRHIKLESNYRRNDGVKFVAGVRETTGILHHAPCTPELGVIRAQGHGYGLRGYCGYSPKGVRGPTEACSSPDVAPFFAGILKSTSSARATA